MRAAGCCVVQAVISDVSWTYACVHHLHHFMPLFLFSNAFMPRFLFIRRRGSALVLAFLSVPCTAAPPPCLLM